MSVRPYPNKPGWHHIDYYKPDPEKPGKKKRVIIPYKGTEAEARAIENEMRLKFKTATVQVNRPIRELWPEFLAAYKIEHAAGTVDDCMFSAKRLLLHFGRFQINSLTQSLVDTYKAARLGDGVKPRTITKEIAYFQSFLKWAEATGQCLPLPFKIKGFPRKMTRAPLPVVPSPDELNRILAALNPKRVLLFRLMVSAGLRRSEACNLKSENVDIGNRMLVIFGKGGKWRMVPIADPVLFAELEAHVKETKPGFLFINPRTKEPFKDPRAALKNAAERAGVTKRVYNHLMRHGFGANMTAGGMGTRHLQETMGHADISTTQLYSQITAENARNEMKRAFTTLVKNQDDKTNGGGA